MIRPDKQGRIDGTTYPEDRAPAGAAQLFAPFRRLWPTLFRLAMGFGLSAVRAREGDVLVVVGGDRMLPAARREVVVAARAAGCRAAVFLPRDCRVHAEPSRLATEDRGYVRKVREA